jgi:hypothetical protein
MPSVFAGSVTSVATPADYVTPLINQTEQLPPLSIAQPGMNISLLHEFMANRYTITTPTLLQGTRCYVDASTAPYHPTTPPQQAGIGVFIVNM